jgi:ribonuclease T1
VKQNAVKLALASAVASAVVAALATFAASVTEVDSRSSATGSAAAEVALSTLPPQAHDTYRRILAGGPFPYDKDGSVFGNRERLLPQHPRGHYREYTVKTPGSPDRGARRIVCGGARPEAPEACFYTADHYASFRLLRP